MADFLMVDDDPGLSDTSCLTINITECDSQERPVSEPRKKKHTKEKQKKITFGDDVRHKSSSVIKVPYSRERKQSIAPPPVDKRPDWYEDLTEQQINMFKEVFEMLDKDGGGSIDAEELYAVLKELDINISLEEIKNVLGELDKDGNGEIDFDEFLYCMAETSHYLDMIGEDKDPGGGYNKRQTLFFTAITRFAIKNSLGEIERYYTNKVNKAPHVISCYTAGARLIGLNDRQLEKEMRRIQKAAKNHKSPYAQPLPFVTVVAKRKKTTAAKKEKEVPPVQSPKPTDQSEEDGKQSIPETELHSPSSDDSVITGGIPLDYKPPSRTTRRAALTVEDIEVIKVLKDLAESGNVVAKIPDVHLLPQIRNKIASGDISAPICSSVRKRMRSIQLIHKDNIPLPTNNHKQSKHHKKEPMWKIPRIERGQAPLPVIKLFERDNLKTFTIEDVPDIRKWVSDALDVYYSTLKKAHVKTAFSHWKDLHADQIKSKYLLEQFRKAYRTYSPHEEEEVFTISPWIPGRPQGIHVKENLIGSSNGTSPIGTASNNIPGFTQYQHSFRSNGNSRPRSTPPTGQKTTAPKLSVKYASMAPKSAPCNSIRSTCQQRK